jgi:hypothetical protein
MYFDPMSNHLWLMGPHGGPDLDDDPIEPRDRDYNKIIRKLSSKDKSVLKKAMRTRKRRKEATTSVGVPGYLSPYSFKKSTQTAIDVDDEDDEKNESINEVRWPDNQTSRLLAQAFKDARVKVHKVWEKGNHKYILRVKSADGPTNVKMELNVISNVIMMKTQSGHVKLGELQPGSRGRKLTKNLKMLSKLPSFGVAGLKGLKYKIESINERKLSSHQKKAILIAIEMSGNMTGAVKKIERIKKGLSNDKKVKDALRLANESMAAPFRRRNSRGLGRVMKVGLNEGKWSKIMRSVRKGSKSGPWSIVVYKNKKVKHQRLVKILQQIPAHYEDVKKKYPRDSIGIEDKYGERVYTESINEYHKFRGKMTYGGGKPQKGDYVKTIAGMAQIEKIRGSIAYMKLPGKKTKGYWMNDLKNLKPTEEKEKGKTLWTESVNEARIVGYDKSYLKNAKKRLKVPHEITKIEYKRTPLRSGVQDKFVRIWFKLKWKPGRWFDPEEHWVSVFYDSPERLKMIGKTLKLKLKESVNESDLGLTLKKGKTITVTHKKSGKELVIIDKPNVKREYEKIGYFAEGTVVDKKTITEASDKTGWKLYHVYDISSKLWKEMKYDLRDQFDELVKVGEDYSVFQNAQGTSRILKQIKRLMDKIS